MNSSDIKEYHALVNGRCSNTIISSGAVAALIKHVSTLDRQTGKSRYFCSHTKLINIDNSALLDPHAYQDKNTKSADDYVVQCLLPARTAKADLEAVIDAQPKVGSGILAADIAVDAQTVTVTVKDADLLTTGADEIFRANQYIKVCSHSDTITEDGVEEVKLIEDTAPTINTELLQVTFTVTEAFTNAFAAGPAVRVTSLIKPGDIAPSFDSVSVDGGNTGSGTLNTGAYPPLLDNAGTKEMDWTGEFTDGVGAYTVTGDAITDSFSGNISADLILTNPDNQRAMATLESGMFEGAWNAGDKFYITTHEATVYRGQKHVIKQGAEAISGNQTDLSIVGDAAPAA